MVTVYLQEDRSFSICIDHCNIRTRVLYLSNFGCSSGIDFHCTWTESCSFQAVSVDPLVRNSKQLAISNAHKICRLH